MVQVKKMCKRIILIIVTISLLISFCAMPASYAKLDLADGEFYYAGTQKGQYTVSEGIFEWLLSRIGDIADWLLGIITMGFRMVFVGWTALLEKMLTWAIESTSGVNVNGDVVESNTDLTSITDSSNNITLEAIVYNHVSALNANLFDLERDIEDLKYSATGHILICKACSQDPGDDVTKCCSTDGTCSCECGGKCQGCKAYIAAVNQYNDEDAEEPIIIKIKKSAAMWYYIIRALAMVGMLIVLIAVGIKMAISNIASDKALYKRMLVDWLVGMIILFSMHYIMLFTIYIGEELVRVIEKTATSVNTVQMKQLAEEDSQNGVEYTNEELELKVYEAIRTRAYDAKLINGLSGTIMYMTLVYFAFKYTIIYIKRLFTIIVLTIMAPAVGFAYALQKALSGKQQAFKNWLLEYVLNVLIQVVHALIYAIFISQALILSLSSIAGIIVALILMNFTSKAYSLFRKIFKISTGGGLVDDTNDSADKLKSNVVEAYTGGKAAVSTLTNTPYTKTVKGVGKAIVSAPFVAIGGIKKGVPKLRTIQSRSEENDDNDDYTNEDENNSLGSRLPSRSRNSSGIPFPRNSSPVSSPKLSNRSDAELLGIGKKTLKENVETAKQEFMDSKTDQEREEAMSRLIKASDEYNRYEKLTVPTTTDIAKAHLDRILEIDNHFIFNKSKGITANLKELYKGIYGSNYIDPETGKKINDESGFFNELKPDKLLGLTEDDKKLLKKQTSLALGTLTGIGSLFLGMGTIVANPKIGMGLLATGHTLTHKGLGRPTTINTYKGKYTFNRFGIPAIKNMEKIALEEARKEKAELRLKSHPGFYKALMSNKVVPVTLAGTAIGASIVTGGIVPVTMLGAGFMAKRFTASTNIGQGIYDFKEHLKDQDKKQEKEFKTDTLHVLKAETQARMQMLLEENDENSEDKNYLSGLYDSLGYEYNPRTKMLTKKGQTSEEDKIREEFENQLDIKMKNNSIEDEIVLNTTDKNKLTDSDVKYIDKEMDNILVKMSAGSTLDMNSEALLDKAITELNAKLLSAGIITKDQSADEVFKSGRAGLRSALKEKSKLVNEKVEIAEKALEGISEEEKSIFKDVIAEISEDRNIADFTEIDSSEVLTKFNEKVEQSSSTVHESRSALEPLGREQRTSYGRKIKKYLKNLEIAKTATHNEAYEEKKAAKQKVESTVKRRKKKLKQILEMTFDTGVDDPTSDIIDQVNNIKNIGGNVTDAKGNTVQVSSDESNRILELLFLRKELEQINNVAMEELELTKGPYKFTKASKDKSEATIDYYKDQLELQKYVQEHSDIYNDLNYERPNSSYTKEQIEERKRMAEIEKGLPNKKRIMEIRERELSMKGPIVDLDDTRKQLLKDK